MTDPRLLDYVKKATEHGMPVDNIKKVLLTSGWKEAEVNAALPAVAPKAPPAPVAAPKAPATPTGEKAPFYKSRLAIYAGGAAVLLLLGAGAYWYFGVYQAKNESAPSDILINQSAKKEDLQTTPTADPLAEVKKSFEAIKAANSNKDEEAYDKYLSKKTLADFGEWKNIWYADMEFVKSEMAGENAAVTIKVTDEVGYAEEQELVFIKEGGVWKIDMDASMKRAEQARAEKEKKIEQYPVTAASYTDLTVYDIKVKPYPPTVNPKTKVVVKIKNTGTAPVKGDGKVRLRAQIGDSLMDSTQSQLFEGLLPGEETSWAFEPFYPDSALRNKDLVSNISKPGTKTVTVFINEDKSVVEKDYTNNSVSRTLDFKDYSK